MKFEEFTFQIDRLRARFGDRTYPQEMTKLLWRRFAFVDQKTFEGQIDYLIVNSKSAPVGVDFEKAIEATESRYSSGTTRCDKCDNSGWSELWRTDTGSVVAERCMCMGGTEALANSIQNSTRNTDPDLAERIRYTFSNAGKDKMTRIPKSELQKMFGPNANNP